MLEHWGATMLYAIAIGVGVLAVDWVWGMRKMVRMNTDPDQLFLAQLLVKAGNGKDEELLAFIGEHQWTRLQIADHVAHALTVAEKLFMPDECSRANIYASGLAVRYHSSQEGSRRDSERTQEPHELSARTQNAHSSANQAAQSELVPVV